MHYFQRILMFLFICCFATILSCDDVDKFNKEINQFNTNVSNIEKRLDDFNKTIDKSADNFITSFSPKEYLFRLMKDMNSSDPAVKEKALNEIKMLFPNYESELLSKYEVTLKIGLKDYTGDLSPEIEYDTFVAYTNLEIEVKTFFDNDIYNPNHTRPVNIYVKSDDELERKIREKLTLAIDLLKDKPHKTFNFQAVKRFHHDNEGGPSIVPSGQAISLSIPTYINDLLRDPKNISKLNDYLVSAILEQNTANSLYLEGRAQKTLYPSSPIEGFCFILIKHADWIKYKKNLIIQTKMHVKGDTKKSFRGRDWYIYTQNDFLDKKMKERIFTHKGEKFLWGVYNTSGIRMRIYEELRENMKIVSENLKNVLKDSQFKKIGTE